jgi:hypothetical protein
MPAQIRRNADPKTMWLARENQATALQAVLPTPIPKYLFWSPDFSLATLGFCAERIKHQPR